jgi:hypothetical protein
MLRCAGRMVMKPRLVVDNTELLAVQVEEPPEDRVVAAWRAMQDVMRVHLEGGCTRASSASAIEIIYGYLDDPQLNADIERIER